MTPKRLVAALPAVWGFAIWVAGCGESAPELDREAERRAVMRSVLVERYTEIEGEGKATRFVLDPALGTRIRTLGERAAASRREQGSRFPDPIVLPDGRRAEPPPIEGLDAGMVADWAARAAPSPTPRNLGLPLVVDWFSSADWSALERRERRVLTGVQFNDPEPKWDTFHAKHPGSVGWVRLSDVGFSSTGDTALIYVVRIAGGFDAAGWWFVLRKRDGRWTIAHEARAFVS